MKSKICISCFIEKDILEFYRDSRRENGRMASCKKCKNIRISVWKKNNRERWNAYVVKNNKLPHRKKQIAEYRKRPHVLDARLEYERMPEQRLRRKMWRQKNKDRCQVYNQNKCRRRNSATKGQKINPDDWIKMKAEHNQKCFYCHKTRALTMDHVIPLCRGGDHSIENIVPACKPCNNAKHMKNFEEFTACL